MQIDNEFAVSVPVGQAWAVLTDLAAIAPCMPGAQLTGVEDGVYTGKVKIKVGPVTSEYAGTARFTGKDGTAYHAVIDARGRDSRGAGNASAVITADLRPDGGSTVVTVSTDLKISGRIAQFGSGMIKEVSAKLLGQFVECLEGKLAALPGGEAAATAAAPAGLVQAAAAGAPAASTAAGVPPATAPSAGGDAVGTIPGSDTATPATAPSAAGGAVGTIQGSAATAPLGGAAPGQAGEPPPLDLMRVAGGSIYKRAVPLAVLLVIIIGLIIYFTAG